MTKAIKPWDDVSGVVTSPTTDLSSANILIGVRRIDGPRGVLAEAELPCGNIHERTQLRVWGDVSDRWTVAENPPGDKADVIRVYRHEFGHSMGIGHNTDGVTNALMDPQISHLRELQQWDIDQQTLRYGKPSPGGSGGDSSNEELIRTLLNCLRKLTGEEKRFIRDLIS